MTEFQYLNQGNSEAQDRLATSFLLAQASTGLARTGVLSGLVVAQTTTASSAVTINSGMGNSQDTVGNGAAIMVNDTQKTLDILTGNPVGGTPRYDIVAFDSATTSIRAFIGTPNASPTDPTIPATAIPLARVRNAAGATTIPASAIDDLRVYTDLFGAPVRVHTQTERDALTQIDGLRVFRLDRGVIEQSFGGVWRQVQPFAQTRGILAVTTTSGTPNVANTITLPAGMFTVPPVVKLSWQSDSGSEPMMRAYTLTAASFGINVISSPSDIGPVSGWVHWEATQTTSTTA